MTKLTSLLIAATVSSVFASSAMAADIDMKVLNLNDNAIVTVTNNGVALANYPVTVENKTLLTDASGSIRFVNRDNVAHNVTFVAEDMNGQRVATHTFLTRSK